MAHSKLAQIPQTIQILFNRGHMSGPEKDAAIDLIRRSRVLSGLAAIEVGVPPEAVEKVLNWQAREVAKAAVDDMQTIIDGENLDLPDWMAPHWLSDYQKIIEEPTVTDGAIAAANMAKMIVLAVNQLLRNDKSIESIGIFTFPEVQKAVTDLSNVARYLTGTSRLRIDAEETQGMFYNGINTLRGIGRILEGDSSSKVIAYCAHRLMEVDAALKTAIEAQNKISTERAA